MSAIEDTLELHLKAYHIDYVREYRFHETRRWRFDFAIPKLKLACEIDGGIWLKGGSGHSGKGKARDCEKDEAALRDGWIVYRCTSDMVKKGSAIETIKILIKIRGNV
jgi:very-short-patch-repair endonuclease